MRRRKALDTCLGREEREIAQILLRDEKVFSSHFALLYCILHTRGSMVFPRVMYLIFTLLIWKLRQNQLQFGSQSRLTPLYLHKGIVLPPCHFRSVSCKGACKLLKHCKSLSIFFCTFQKQYYSTFFSSPYNILV